MNKLKLTIAGMLVACLGIGAVSAQTKTTSAPASKQAPAKKSASKTKPAMATAATANQKAAKPAQHLKKDGTPDMRYKENKTAKPAAAKKAPAKGKTTK